jgi:protein SCO1/2
MRHLDDRVNASTPSDLVTRSVVSYHLLRLRGLIPGSVAFLALAVVGAPAAAGDADHAHHAAYGDHAGELRRSLASYAVPDVTLLDQRGRKVPLRQLLDTDEPVLLNFIFTTCTAICPAMSAIFARVQHDLGSDSGRVRMVSVSIDPEHDTPPELAAYAERFRAGPQWWFLTGSLEDSIAVQRAFDAYRGDKDAHAALTLVRPTRDARWVRYQGFATAPQLVEAVRAPLANLGPEGGSP